MRLLYLLGWLMLVGAFLSAAAETGARGMLPGAGALIPAHDLWQALAPDGFASARRWVETTLHPTLWDPLLTGVLTLPAWLLLGGPGMALVWLLRPSRGPTDDFDPDSVFLYDRLAERAREEDYTDDDDRAPNHEDRPWPEDWDGVVEIDEFGLERVRKPIAADDDEDTDKDEPPPTRRPS